MQKIIIVGVLHEGYTQLEELKEIVGSYNPDQALIEIKQEDIDCNNLDGYSDEMVGIFKWAQDKKIKINGFDTDDDIFANGFSEEKNNEILISQENILKQFDWKDFNKKINREKLNTKEEEAIIDSAKNRMREQNMLKNINKLILSEGNVVIITGCGHLDFFQKNLKNATLPLS